MVSKSGVMGERYPNLDAVSMYDDLCRLAEDGFDIASKFNAARFSDYEIASKYLTFKYGAAPVDERHLDLFSKWADEMDLIGQYQSVLAGNVMNVSESRAVLHHQLRDVSALSDSWQKERDRQRGFVKNTLANKRFKHVVQVGIGGSYLGPRAVYDALKRWVDPKDALSVSFVSNVDPDDVFWKLKSISLSDTLFIVVSKGGDTLETQANFETIRQVVLDSGVSESDLASYFVGVTTPGSVLDDSALCSNVFYMDESIGGRFSVSSVAGTLVLSLGLGLDIVDNFLAGAHVMDRQALTPNLTENMAMMAAMISVWERTFLGRSSRVIVPYSEALATFVAHLQQVDCESNGKSTNRYGEALSYKTASALWGGVGTDSQHSFFQMLHQGVNEASIQFIGFKDAQLSSDSHQQTQLLANLVAQIVALAKGGQSKQSGVVFEGGRSSTLLFGERLCPRTMGALLAFYENVVMFMGFLWNVNSFDQPGVQLGKELSTELLAQKEGDSGLLQSCLSQLLLIKKS